MHLSRYLSYWAHARSNEIALLCEGERLTWGEFDGRVEAIAAALETCGLKPGDRFGCLLPNAIEWCVALLASIKSGAIFVPLNVGFGDRELQEISKDAGCRLILSTESLIQRLDAGLSVPRHGLYFFDMTKAREPLGYEEALLTPPTERRPFLTDDDVLALCYTSGTTGVSKGVIYTHRSMEHVVTGYAFAFDVTTDDRFLLLSPLAFAGGFCRALIALVRGASLRVEVRFEPAAALRRIQEEKITCIGSTPIFLQRMSEAPGFDGANLSSLRICQLGGAPIPSSLLRRYADKGVVVRQSYGLTESGGGATLPPVATALAHPESCGIALPGVDIEIRDESGAPCPRGVTGELYVRGPQCSIGYWGKPALTAETYAGGWIRTGDLARADEHGFQIMDRKKNLVISGGVNVYPAEVERAAATLPHILDFVAFGIPSNTWGEELVAIAHGDDDISAEAIVSELRGLLGKYKSPKRVRISPRPLPRTTSGKVARQGLVELFGKLKDSS
jgi:fatty-acyl-CoA synthase